MAVKVTDALARGFEIGQPLLSGETAIRYKNIRLFIVNLHHSQLPNSNSLLISFALKRHSSPDGRWFRLRRADEPGDHGREFSYAPRRLFMLMCPGSLVLNSLIYEGGYNDDIHKPVRPGQVGKPDCHIGRLPGPRVCSAAVTEGFQR